MEKPDYYNNSKPKADNKHKIKWKKCMNYESCGKEFWSEHKFHRLCPSCRRRYS